MKGYPPGKLFLGKLPNIRRANFFVQFEEYITDQRAGKCRVYWGKHACDEPRNHYGEHECICGEHPLEHSVFWGEDLNEWENAQLPHRRELLQKVEIIHSWHDDFDKKGNYNPTRRRGRTAA